MADYKLAAMNLLSRSWVVNRLTISSDNRIYPCTFVIILQLTKIYHFCFNITFSIIILQSFLFAPKFRLKPHLQRRWFENHANQLHAFCLTIAQYYYFKEEFSPVPYCCDASHITKTVYKFTHLSFIKTKGFHLGFQQFPYPIFCYVISSTNNNCVIMSRVSIRIILENNI